MWELKKEIETRKENLILILKNKKELLSPEKQHQIYGAIKELDHVVRLVEQYREQEMIRPRQLDIDTSYIEASGGEEEEEEVMQKEKANTIKVIGENVRKFKYPIRIKFAKNDA
jgi:hypothetical protein